MMTNILKLVWFAGCIGVLVYALVVCGPLTESMLRGECFIMPAVIMAIMSAPSGILWWVLLSAAGYGLSLAGIEIPDSISVHLIVWLGFIIVGYLQWFLLVPFLVHRARRTTSKGVVR
jgi:hypothetical protein